MDRRVERTELNSRALDFCSRLASFSFRPRSRSILKPSLNLSRMARLRSMHSSRVLFCPLGGGPSEVGSVIICLRVGGGGSGFKVGVPFDSAGV